MTSVLIVAGEKSGENYGAAVVRRFKDRHPETQFFGIGGTKMAGEGVELLFPMDELAVVGIFEIITRLPRIRKIFVRIQKEIKERRPAAAVLIDSPDFNLRLAKKLKKLAVPVLYYISPTVWAWRAGRLKAIKKYIHKMCLIFPFEEEIYKKQGIPARYVGHPLLERVKTTFGKAEFFKKYKLNPACRLITLLPGSRRSEIRFHLPVLIETLKKIRAETPVHFILVLAEDLEPDVLNWLIPADAPPLTILRKDAYEAIAAADLVLSACGTATLETALLGPPLIAFYRLSPLTYRAGIKFVKIRHYSIVNILAGERIIPEFIQQDFTVENLFRETMRILESGDIRSAMTSQFQRIKFLLGNESASRNVALELEELIQRPSF